MQDFSIFKFYVSKWFDLGCAKTSFPNFYSMVLSTLKTFVYICFNKVSIFCCDSNRCKFFLCLRNFSCVGTIGFLSTKNFSSKYWEFTLLPSIGKFYIRCKYKSVVTATCDFHQFYTWFNGDWLTTDLLIRIFHS